MKIKRIIMILTLLATALLAVLSILGAFLGAEKAKLFFNSIPLSIYWSALVIMLVAGFIAFPRLWRKPGLLMIHLGCLLIVAASMWGSDSGHNFAEKFLGITKTPAGYMPIMEGDAHNQIMNKDFKETLGELPFNIRLEDFRIEYYPSKNSTPQLYIEHMDGSFRQFNAIAGTEAVLDDSTKLKILRTFDNFKINLKDGKKVVVDQPGTKDNPAVKIEVVFSKGETKTTYIFEKFPSMNEVQLPEGIKLHYVTQQAGMIKDYYSDLVVIEDGKEVARKTIQVNDPMHYGGYHFYQHFYDSQAGKYTILSVKSDSGLYAVYAGYWLLCIGIVWQLWLRHAAGYAKQKLPGEASA